MNTADGSPVFEQPFNYQVTNSGILSRGGPVFLVYNSSPEGRVIDLLGQGGSTKASGYLLGNFQNYALHSDEAHLLCLTEKKAVFLRWEFPASSVNGLPELHGDFWFFNESKLAGCVKQTNKRIFKILDLAKPKADPGAALSAWVKGTSIPFEGVTMGAAVCLNREQGLVSFKDGVSPEECVVARIEPNGIREVSRWKCASTPLLSPSGNKAWSREALYETATGQMLRKYDLNGSTETLSARWLDENRVLELQTQRWKEEDSPQEFQGNTYILWQVDSGRVLAKLQEPRALTFEVSPDGRWIAEGGADGRLRIRSAQTLDVSKDYKVHNFTVNRVLWHPSKPVIITCCYRENVVKAYDHRDGRMVQSFRSLNMPDNIAISPKGTLLGVKSWGSPAILTLDLSHVRD